MLFISEVEKKVSFKVTSDMYYPLLVLTEYSFQNYNSQTLHDSAGNDSFRVNFVRIFNKLFGLTTLLILCSI